MSKTPEHDFPPWLTESIRARVRLAVARTWTADADWEDLVHDVWLFLLEEGETPASVTAKPRAELWARLLTLANRAAARAARAKKRHASQAGALTGIHDGSADPGRAMEIRDALEGIAHSLLDESMEDRRLVGRKLNRDRNLDFEMVRAFAEKSGLTEHDLLTESKAMTPNNRQKLHRLMRRLRAAITCVTLLVAAEASVARVGEPSSPDRSAPAPALKDVDRDHWN